MSKIVVIWFTALLEVFIILMCQYVSVYGPDWILDAKTNACNVILFTVWLALTIANLLSTSLFMDKLK